eukprot:120931-Pyramimonas_sp.AAC.1
MSQAPPPALACWRQAPSRPPRLPGWRQAPSRPPRLPSRSHRKLDTVSANPTTQGTAHPISPSLIAPH